MFSRRPKDDDEVSSFPLSLSPLFSSLFLVFFCFENCEEELLFPSFSFSLCAVFLLNKSSLHQQHLFLLFFLRLLLFLVKTEKFFSFSFFFIFAQGLVFSLSLSVAPSLVFFCYVLLFLSSSFSILSITLFSPRSLSSTATM